MCGNRANLCISGLLGIMSINNERSKEQGQRELDSRRRNVVFGKPYGALSTHGTWRDSAQQKMMDYIELWAGNDRNKK